MKKSLLTFLFAFVALIIHAQTNVTLSNPSFEEGTDGWTTYKMLRNTNDDFSKKVGDAYARAWVARGSKIANASVKQTVKGLAQGKYRLSANACHIQQVDLGSDVSNGEAQTGAYLFVGDNATVITESDTYTVDFAIIGGDNTVELGCKAVNATGNFLAVDNFVLTRLGDPDVADYKQALEKLISDAEALSSSSSTALNNAISAAQTVIENENASLDDAMTAWSNLNQEYKKAVVSGLIVNPSFENDVNGWTVHNMVTQSNNVFSKKQGTYYLESWVSRGSKLANASVSQTISLPSGNYRLSAYALHIQQDADNSTKNLGAAQKGAYIFAGSAQTTVTSMRQFSLDFSVVDGQSNVEIGLKTDNPTGNWLCVDDFILTYVSEVTPADYAKVVTDLVAIAQSYIDKGVQESVATQLQDAISVANAAVGTGPDYDMTALVAAKTQLEEAIEAGKTSRAIYDEFEDRIAYGEKVLGWWKDEPTKATTVGLLQSAIETAKEKVTDYTLPATRLRTAINTLNTAIARVDKKIYACGWSYGTESQLQNPSSQWCYERSYQSKHWILFWEKGYGTEVPEAVPGILETADKIFEFYANDLKFITINQKKSKTDTYKMVIRLRETSEWEATGSGVDNTIGLLTLSRWAYTSRGGQTVAHEIGHCFQYQTHCDNKNDNGWMYNWGTSTANVFWEMCAQWQAYKYYPNMQFDNEWFNGTINGLHRNPLEEELRYNNYFIQDYFVDKHGMDIIGRLWNESKSPEDPFQAYMRITMDSGMSSAEKLEQFNDEMWEYGAKMTTFDMDHIRKAGAGRINYRTQTALTKITDGFWRPDASNCVETFGNNAIRVNLPSTAKTVYAELTGLPTEKGYTLYKTNNYGWKFGFVALKKDGTRIYGDVATTTSGDPTDVVSFEYPGNCSYLWLVVSGAPTAYWSRNWNGVASEKEQMPYKVKFYQTNVYGNANNNSYPVGIDEIAVDADPEIRPADNNVYTLTGQIVRQGSTSLDGLPEGIYVVNGKKVMVR